jgi:predicted nucleic acid-binding protein
MTLGLENPEKIILLDDLLAREIAKAAGLKVWGTLKILLEAKSAGLTDAVAPLIDNLSRKGMWISDNIRKRILNLAGEQPQVAGLRNNRR